MRQAPPLSEFQIVTERALLAALERRCLRLEHAEVAGETELCIRGNLGGTGIEVYIYEDGAGILGPDLDRRFVREEYGSLEALSQAFVAEAAEWASRGAERA